MFGLLFGMGEKVFLLVYKTEGVVELLVLKLLDVFDLLLSFGELGAGVVGEEVF